MLGDTPISKVDHAFGAFYAVPRPAADADPIVRRSCSWKQQQLHRQISQAKAEAEEAFAALNGWKADGHSYFHPDAIGRRNRKPLYSEHELGLPDDSRLFDHCINFRADGRNAAVLAQPYGHVDLDACQRWAARLGLAVHLPPDPLASIHYPGWTYFVVITKAGVTVKWLPDQDGRLAERWAARKAAA